MGTLVFRLVLLALFFRALPTQDEGTFKINNLLVWPMIIGSLVLLFYFI